MLDPLGWSVEIVIVSRAGRWPCRECASDRGGRFFPPASCAAPRAGRGGLLGARPCSVGSRQYAGDKPARFCFAPAYCLCDLPTLSLGRNPHFLRESRSSVPRPGLASESKRTVPDRPGLCPWCRARVGGVEGAVDDAHGQRFGGLLVAGERSWRCAAAQSVNDRRRGNGDGVVRALRCCRRAPRGFFFDDLGHRGRRGAAGQ